MFRKMEKRTTFLTLEVWPVSVPLCNRHNASRMPFPQVIEFDMDLEYYWVDSYGYELNYRQACPQVKDFISKFK